MEIGKVVGLNLRRWRLARGISQENLAVDAEVARAYLGRLERGGENPTVGLLQRLADALEIRVKDLVEDPIAEPQKPLPKGPKPARGAIHKPSKPSRRPKAKSE